ncbi:MAG TPA: tRNA (adenosine(37)-N6)-threonylcarbamoyltransferase complex ATPase subunit type 1 TsaE [Clostridia bacterium]|nr:tRNA (adenosine(37)-N6)-threonylcarbamoyltransferase complex ATPase subunit type 1 TsaE [Clostridia bacterium]
MIIKTLSSEETMLLGERLAGLLMPGDLVCLIGELGAGKTHFAKGVAVGLGVEDTVTSPTFTLIKEYEGRIPFYHMDAYRLESAEELEDLGYDEYLYGEGVTLIEWADRIKEALPGDRLDIVIETVGEFVDNTRLFAFTPYGGRYLDLVKGMEEIDCIRD